MELGDYKDNAIGAFLRLSLQSSASTPPSNVLADFFKILLRNGCFFTEFSNRSTHNGEVEVRTLALIPALNARSDQWSHL
jgi:hypothetical protein